MGKFEKVSRYWFACYLFSKGFTTRIVAKETGLSMRLCRSLYLEMREKADNGLKKLLSEEVTLKRGEYILSNRFLLVEASLLTSIYQFFKHEKLQDKTRIQSEVLVDFMLDEQYRSTTLASLHSLELIIHSHQFYQEQRSAMPMIQFPVWRGLSINEAWVILTDLDQKHAQALRCASCKVTYYHSEQLRLSYQCPFCDGKVKRPRVTKKGLAQMQG